MSSVPGTGSVTITDIVDALESTHGITLTQFRFLEDLVDASDFALFDPTWLDGAASKAEITKVSQWRNYPLGTAPTNVIVSGPTGTNKADNQTYTVTFDGTTTGLSYFWTVTGYGTIVSGQGTSSIVVAWTYDNAYTTQTADISCTVTNTIGSYGSNIVTVYPYIYLNVYHSATVNKNNCASGGIGSSVTYQVPEGTYRDFSQAAANAQAQSDLDANKQSYANSNGYCTWYNTLRALSFTRNNCGGCYYGSNVVYTVNAGTYSSTSSQSAANALADAEISANGQNYANSNGTCTYTGSSISWGGSYTTLNCNSCSDATTTMYAIVDGAGGNNIEFQINGTGGYVPANYGTNGYTITVPVNTGPVGFDARRADGCSNTLLGGALYSHTSADVAANCSCCSSSLSSLSFSTLTTTFNPGSDTIMTMYLSYTGTLIESEISVSHHHYYFDGESSAGVDARIATAFSISVISSNSIEVKYSIPRDKLVHTHSIDLHLCNGTIPTTGPFGSYYT